MDAAHGMLVDAVRRGRGVIDPEYVRADREAIRNQSAHRLLVDIVVIAGALTILAGIAPLIGTLTQSTMRVVTTISAATAVIAVLLGIFVGLQGRWLLTRHRAERLRFLLFEALLEPALEESLNLDRWSERLTERSAAIARLQSAEMTAWLARDRIVESADDGVPSGVYLDELVRTYVLDLIDSQAAYFARRASRNRSIDAVAHRLHTSLFFLGVGAIVPASVLRLAGGHATAANAWTIVAAGAPAVSGMIGGLRSAHEYSRNGARFQAKAVALRALRERLCDRASRGERLRDLRHVLEHVETEHREWLRLMIAASWY